MKSDILEHGPTEGCPGCKAIVRGSLIRAGHTDQCRQRIYDLIHDEEYGRARIERAAARAAGAADQGAPRQGGGEDVPNVPSSEAMPPGGNEEPNDDAMNTPGTDTAAGSATEAEQQQDPQPRTCAGGEALKQRLIQAARTSTRLPPLPPPATPPMPTPSSTASSSTSKPAQKRKADAPPDDPRVGTTDTPEVITSRGEKRKSDSPPDDPRLQQASDPADADVVYDSTRPAGMLLPEECDRRCATCGKRFSTKGELHRHLRSERHQVVGDSPKRVIEVDESEAQQRIIDQKRKAIMDHVNSQ